MTARIRTRSERQAMDWSLALVSQGIETTIDANDDGHALLVAEEDRERALDVIVQYRVENRGWPFRYAMARRGFSFDWTSLAWVCVVIFFFAMQGRMPALEGVGLMDTQAVIRGEWSRLFTAIWLHADVAHLAANTGIGLVLLALVLGRFGTGLGLLAAYLAGFGGNLAICLVYPEGHRSLGASGMVMGCVGLLAVPTVSLTWRNARALKVLLSGIAAGVMLFVLMGLSPGSDVVAHFGGFISGILLGAILTFVPKISKNGLVNFCGGLLFVALAIIPWWQALARIR